MNCTRQNTVAIAWQGVEYIRVPSNWSNNLCLCFCFFAFFNGIRLSWSDFCVGLKYSKVETYVCLKCSRSLHWGFYVLWFLLPFVMLFVREQDNTIQYNTIIQFHMQENTLSCSKYLFPSWNAIFPPFCVCVQHSGYYFQILWAIRDTCEKSYIF